MVEWSGNAKPFCLSLLSIVSDCCWLAINTNGQISQLEVRLITSIWTTPTVWIPPHLLFWRGQALRNCNTYHYMSLVIICSSFSWCTELFHNYVEMALKKGIPFKCVQKNDILRTRSAVGVVYG